MFKTTFRQSENWFWVGKNEDSIEIHRVVVWRQNENGIVGLISTKLNSDLQNPRTGTTLGEYKHLDDLNLQELAALEMKKLAE